MPAALFNNFISKFLHGHGNDAKKIKKKEAQKEGKKKN
jgi:hypothetical protein